jgi:hypothetical protein
MPSSNPPNYLYGYYDPGSGSDTEKAMFFLARQQISYKLKELPSSNPSSPPIFVVGKSSRIFFGLESIRSMPIKNKTGRVPNKRLPKIIDDS